MNDLTERDLFGAAIQDLFECAVAPVARSVRLNPWKHCDTVDHRIKAGNDKGLATPNRFAQHHRPGTPNVLGLIKRRPRTFNLPLTIPCHGRYTVHAILGVRAWPH